MNIEIDIQKTAFGGDGIGQVEGKTCFVKGALPGETVIARVVQDKRNFMKAKVLRVLDPSANRIEPPCPYVDVCGGCQYQHVSYDEELKLKETQIREMAERFLKAGERVTPIRRSAKEYGYRNGVTLHRTETHNRPQRLGFIAEDNETTTPVKDCLLADRRLAPIFSSLHRPRTGAAKIAFKLSEKGEIVSDERESFFRIRLLEESLIAHSAGFFQNNLFVTESLCRQAAAWIQQIEPDHFFDLYAGVGTFSFLSAKGIPKITAIEESVSSLQALRMNVAERKRAVQVIEGRVEKAFPALPFTAGEKTPVCLDPPRHGLEPAFAEFLSRDTRFHGLIYISCDPPSFFRDLRTILAGGRYHLTEIAPFDMFPRTKHIETAAFFKSTL